MKKRSISYTRLITIIVIALTAWPAGGYAKIIMKPYLQASANGSIFVLAECDTKDPVTVEFGTSDKLGSKSVTSFYLEAEDKRRNTYIHRIKLDKLSPASVYYYKASQAGGQSYESTFKSPVMPGTPFRFTVMGDCRSNTDVHSKIDKKMKSASPYFSIYGGDLCYSQEYYAWKEDFFTDAELDISASVPFFNCVGNHEGWKKNTRAFTQAPESASGQQDYYSFDFGDAHFVVLSTEASCKKGSPQYEFVKKDLESTDKKWKIVAFHTPAYCKGGWHKPNEMMIQASKEIFEPNKVDIVIAGHSHFYQHHLVRGIHHFVIAGGGAPLVKPEDLEFTVKSAMEYHYAVFDVSVNQVSMKVYNLKGEILDLLELKK